MVIDQETNQGVTYRGEYTTFSKIVMSLMYGFGSISGASMNAFRSLGPTIASGNLNSLWLYVVGPTLGTVIAAAT